MDNGFKFHHRHSVNSHRSTIYVNEDANIGDVFEAFESFLIASGFSQKTIDEQFERSRKDG